MEQLSYAALKNLGYSGYLLDSAPERILQFGEGNFLRAFVENFVDLMNERAGFNSKVVITKLTPSANPTCNLLNQQEGLYTLLLRGREKGEAIERRRVISCVSRCLNPYADYASLLDCARNPDLRFLVSNTTEAGIAFDPDCKFDDAPPASFPGKLTRFLYERYSLGLPGFVILACELIDRNGDELRKCVLQYIELWGLDDEFRGWIEAENIFCSTLVDRIVTGYPKGEGERLCTAFGYEDKLIDTGELFASWVIEGPQSILDELPAEAAGLPIQVVADHSPYKQRKVRILNGAHTSMVMAAYLAGQDIVRGCMEDELIRSFMEKTIHGEIIPTLDLPKEELLGFASAVTERFNNPYIDHSLLAISLNSTAKWKARVMPSLVEYVRRFNTLPVCITFSFAAYIAFYHKGVERGDNCLIARRGKDVYEIRDDSWALDFFYEHRNASTEEIAHEVICNERMWGSSLADIPGFEAAVAAALGRIEAVGMYEAMKECI